MFRKRKKNAIAHASSLTLQSHPQVGYQVRTLIKQFAETNRIKQAVQANSQKL